MKKKEKNREKSRVSTTFSELFGDKIEIMLNKESSPCAVVVCGAKSFLKYEENEIEIELSEKILSLKGDNFECSTFSGGSLKLCGNIKDISFK